MGRGITAQGENSFGIGLDSAARTITAAHTMAIVGGNVGIGTVSPGSYTLYVNGTAYSTGGWSGSDQRWKKNIAPLENSLDRVRDLSGVSFEFRNGELDEIEFPEGRQIGLIAQEVEKVVPEVVRTDDDGYKAVAYEKLTALLVEAVKELDAENIELRAENEDMRREVDELRVEMEGLKALLGIAPTSFKTKAGR